ncbi:MAG: DUF6111 family protein [Stellaceae bacterium]
MREILEIIVPLALPTVLYLLWVLLMRRSGPGAAPLWQAVPWLWLAAAGAALLALFLFVVTVHFGTHVRGTYVAPQLKNGQIVPGHVVPAPKS